MELTLDGLVERAEAGHAAAPAAAPAPSLSIDEAAALAARGGADYGKGLRVLVEIGDGRPEDAAVQYAVGKVLCDLGTFDLAYRFLKQSVVLAPENGRNWMMFAVGLMAMKQFPAARIAIERAAGLCEQDPVAHLIHGRVLAFEGEDAAALAAYDRAIAVPGPTSTLNLAQLEKGQLLQTLGDIDGARALFAESIKVNPGFVNGYAALVAARASFEEPQATLERLRAALEDPGLDPDTRAQGLFAVGTLLDRDGDHAGAFAHFVAGNRLRASGRGYNPQAMVALVDDLIATFTPQTFADLAELADPTERPVFIVGMPRSGTTLTEAILAGHPQVAARGERHELPQLVESLSSRNSYALTAEGGLEPGGDGLCYPRDLMGMDRAALVTMRDGYLGALSRNAPDAALRLTDKMPLNFIHLGMVGVLFPHARIVHCTRDAIATCTSCFVQNFADDLLFSHDLESLGHYHRQYRRLMAHWRQVLPNPMLDFAYEAVVADQERESRRLIAHLGLDWDDACLDFQQSGFRTNTASSWQVRQKIYTSAVEGWRKYEPFLAPLRQALDAG